MAAVQKTKEVTTCDVCGSDAHVYSRCDSCGKDYCYECSKAHTKEYAHSIYCRGSGDACYCLQCDVELRAKGDKRLAAFQKIQDLRAESRRWGEDFKTRCDAAERAVAASSGEKL